MYTGNRYRDATKQHLTPDVAILVDNRYSSCVNRLELSIRSRAMDDYVYFDDVETEVIFPEDGYSVTYSQSINIIGFSPLVASYIVDSISGKTTQNEKLSDDDFERLIDFCYDMKLGTHYQCDKQVYKLNSVMLKKFICVTYHIIYWMINNSLKKRINKFILEIDWPYVVNKDELLAISRKYNEMRKEKQVTTFIKLGGIMCYK